MRLDRHQATIELGIGLRRGIVPRDAGDRLRNYFNYFSPV